MNEELAPTIGNIIRALRLQAKWSLESVALALRACFKIKASGGLLPRGSPSPAQF
jgi:hypothetical protein